MVNYDNDDYELFIGRDLAHTRSYSENVANKIDEEVQAIIAKCYEDAKKIVNDNIEILHKCAALLIEKERITREEFEALFTEVNA